MLGRQQTEAEADAGSSSDCATWKPEIRNGSEIRNASNQMQPSLPLPLSLSLSICLSRLFGTCFSVWVTFLCTHISIYKPPPFPYVPPCAYTIHIAFYVRQLAAAAFESCHTLHLACCPIYANMSLTSARFGSTPPSPHMRSAVHVGGILLAVQWLRFMHSKIGNKRVYPLSTPPTPLANFVCSQRNRSCIDGQRQLCHIIFYAHIKLTYERVHDNKQTWQAR